MLSLFPPLFPPSSLPPFSHSLSPSMQTMIATLLIPQIVWEMGLSRKGDGKASTSWNQGKAEPKIPSLPWAVSGGCQELVWSPCVEAEG